jgi:hypothetical protein
MIDISSLDNDTKEKLFKYQKRCEELSEGIKRSTTINADYMVVWDMGLESTIIDIGPDIPGIPFELHWDHMDELMENLKEEIDKEIKEIMKFSDEVADKLGVDRHKFFLEHLAA